MSQPDQAPRQGQIPFAGRETEVITLLALSNQHMAKVAELRDLEQEITAIMHTLGVPLGAVPRVDHRAKVVHWTIPGPRLVPKVPEKDSAEDSS